MAFPVSSPVAAVLTGKVSDRVRGRDPAASGQERGNASTERTDAPTKECFVHRRTMNCPKPSHDLMSSPSCVERPETRLRAKKTKKNIIFSLDVIHRHADDTVPLCRVRFVPAPHPCSTAVSLSGGAFQYCLANGPPVLLMLPFGVRPFGLKLVPFWLKQTRTVHKQTAPFQMSAHRPGVRRHHAEAGSGTAVI